MTNQLSKGLQMYGRQHAYYHVKNPVKHTVFSPGISAIHNNTAQPKRNEVIYRPLVRTIVYATLIGKCM